jgi:hypothetical protein
MAIVVVRRKKTRDNQIAAFWTRTLAVNYETHMIKTTKSKHAKDALLIRLCMIGGLRLYFLDGYLFVTAF